MALTEQFPVGLRVLVVDDDITCLKILEQMLRRCLYTVTLCSQATFALKLLRESADCFDMVLSDVHMPDMDGYKLLEHVGLEMNLPVIMMSADESTSAVMRGIRHGACDYLIKPIRQEELNNLWQHVARKRWNETKSLAHALSPEVDDPQKHGNDAAVFASSQNESTEGSMRIQKAKRDSREDDDSELDNDDPSSSKKPRVVWSVELHQQFVNVVNQLGLDKAVPKRILELMNVPGLTRENVASHLQKFRLYLKRLSGGTYQGSICNALYGPFDPNARFDVQTLSASGQLSSQTLEALHAELLGYTAYDQSVQMQTEQLQKYSERPKPVPVQDTAQILAKSRAYAPRILSQPRIPSGNISPGHGAWPPSAVESAASGENQVEGLTKEDNSCGDTSRLQHWQPAVPVRNQSIIVQPSCLVASQSSSTVDAAYDNLSSNQVSTSSRNLSIDYGSLSQQSPGAGPYSALDLRRRGLGSYPLGAVVSPSISSCPIVADSFSLDQLLLKESYKNSSAVPSFPSRFAVEVDPLLDSSGSRKINDLTKANCVKAESDFDWGSNANSDASGFEYSRLNDLSHIL